MDDIIALYRSRVSRLERTGTAPRSLAAARALLDAAQRARSLEELEQLDAAGKLSLGAAIARIADTEARRAAHYDALGEPVRAAPHHEVLRVLREQPPRDEDALISMVGRIHQQAGTRITADEELSERLWGRREALDDHEVLERAEVPPAWRTAQATSLARQRDELRAAYRTADANLAAFIPGWQPRWEQLAELRHRRRLAWSDQECADRVRRYRAIVGGG